MALGMTVTQKGQGAVAEGARAILNATGVLNLVKCLVGDYTSLHFGRETVG